MAHQRVVEAGKLPRAQVARDAQHAIAARLRRQVVLQSLGSDPVPCSRACGRTRPVASLDACKLRGECVCVQSRRVEATPIPGCAPPPGAGGPGSNTPKRQEFPPAGAPARAAPSPADAPRPAPANIRDFPARWKANTSLDCQRIPRRQKPPRKANEGRPSLAVPR